jgi:MinD superfamily P-loop ATPase
MKELVILSGKGGTGKTTIVGALASLMPDQVLVDCDVDAANLYLLAAPETRHRHDFSGGARAEIDPDSCISCGVCFEQCRFEAIVQDVSDPDNPLPTYSVDPLGCEGCGVCERLCIDHAITMKPVINGEWFESETRFGPMVHGRLGIGEGNSGKLVSVLRNKAHELASKNEHKYVVVDGPPGIGCPVIAAVTGAHYVLVVTEPTLSAFHDLRRVVELVGHFGISAGVIVNKADLNENIAEKIESTAKEEKIDFWGRVPYDKPVTRPHIYAKPNI